MNYYYSGILGRDKSKYHEDIMRPYNAWNNQTKRCNWPKDSRYINYGAKGIKVEYSRRELIGWYLENIKNFKGKMPSIGRIDHSKNYSFDNIEIQSHSDNSKERIQRLGTPFKKVPIKVYDLKMNLIMICKDRNEAHKIFKVSKSTVSRIADKICKTPRKYIFEYVRGGP